MFDLAPFRRGGHDVFSFFDEMEKNFMKNFGNQLPAFQTDIVDEGDKFVLQADIPGFQKEDIEIHVDGSRLTILAKHDVKEEENKDNYVRKERKFGSFTRSFDVSDIQTEMIEADYQNGVLKLELPKKEKTNNARKIDIR